MPENRITQNACGVVGMHEYRVISCHTSIVSRESVRVILECRDCEKKLDILIPIQPLIQAHQEKPFLEVIYNSEEEGG